MCPLMNPSATNLVGARHAVPLRWIKRVLAEVCWFFVGAALASARMVVKVNRAPPIL